MSVEAMNSIIAATADGNTQVTLFDSEAQMTAALATGTSPSAVPFSVTRFDSATLPPEQGPDTATVTVTVNLPATVGIDMLLSGVDLSAGPAFRHVAEN
ncbi:MAG TPA: hypothetical protein VKE94_11225 [Gemmataceae bacterium]|nr:hypothetical protein [Gemmataceae bacterium]